MATKPTPPAPDPVAASSRAADYPVPGVLGEHLAALDYRARLVIERVDGDAITDGDRAQLDPLMADVAALGTHDPAVLDWAATRRLAEARPPLAALIGADDAADEEATPAAPPDTTTERRRRVARTTVPASPAARRRGPK